MRTIQSGTPGRLRALGLHVAFTSVLLLGLTDKLHSAALIQIPFLPGGNRNEANAVSGDGYLVVGTARNGDGFDEVFRWSPFAPFSSPIDPLGDLPGSVVLAHGNAVSRDGSVIVGDGLSDLGQEAFRWTEPTGMVPLGDLLGGSFQSIARGVSADGSVVVGEGRSTATEAFRWTQAGGLQPLGFLDGGTSSGANAVSPDGSVIVGFSTGTSGIEAFRWTQAGGMIGLDQPGSLTATTAARDVSADGLVVVGEGVRAFTGPEAIRWTPEGLQGLGDLPGGDFSSEALAVSADGSTVVGRAHTAAGDTAFIWDQENGMRSLADVLDDLGLGSASFTLTEATGISDDGRVVVGKGITTGGQELGWSTYLAVYWDSESADGCWSGTDCLANWLQGREPRTNEDVVIRPDFGGKLLGPRLNANTTIESLAIGSRVSGISFLHLDTASTSRSASIIANGHVSVERLGGISGSGTLIAKAGITNEGEISLDPGGQINGEHLRNLGLIKNGGDIFNRLTNEAVGEVRALAGQSVRFHGFGNVSHGEINVLGGLVEFTQDLLNAPTGFIAGHGVLAVGSGTTNQGIVALSDDTEVLGDVTNEPGGRIVITGNAAVTFFDDVHTDGLLRVALGSSAVFFGTLSGTGGATGGGTIFIEGDLRLGSSPGRTRFDADVVLGPLAAVQIEVLPVTAGATPQPGVEADEIVVAGELSLAGTLQIVAPPGLGLFDSPLGTEYGALTYENLNGTMFDAVTGSLIANDLALAPVFRHGHAAGELVLRVSMPGDVNLDNRVGVADLSTFALNFGSAPGLGNWELGDFNADGAVTVADLSLLALNFGFDLEAGEVATGLSLRAAAALAGIDPSLLPVPASAALLAVPGLMLLRRRRGA